MRHQQVNPLHKLTAASGTLSSATRDRATLGIQCLWALGTTGHVHLYNKMVIFECFLPRVIKDNNNNSGISKNVKLNF